MTRSDMPLSRFTVLDLTRVRAGPTAVRQLADWGANVIKIEAPEAVDKARGMGGARHGPDFQNLHRNKRFDDPQPQGLLPATRCSCAWSSARTSWSRTIGPT